MSELTKVYNPKEIEERRFAEWETAGLMKASAGTTRRAHTIVIPPPNVTGMLTIGHVLNNTIQDVLTRWKRMDGFEALWLPGTDHAGIATQSVVEKSLRAQGTSRRELGREKFLEKVWDWKQHYGGTIIRQLRRLGASCDWERERFTMDDGLSRAVQEMFVRLFEKDLVYRGKYIVNWCPHDHTAISDDEVTYGEREGSLWYVRYPVAGSKDSVTVATTRPETMLGDVAVAVNPGDARYKKLIGREVILPLVGKPIPVIADEAVDPEFGTGVVKVTPAHDQNDFLIRARHNDHAPPGKALPVVSIFDESAVTTAGVPEAYRSLTREDARTAVVRDLEAGGFLEKTVPHVHNVGRCYRCNTVIEPLLSDQWFVRMKVLAVPALEAVRSGAIRFHPDRWTKTYEHWLLNIRDWCISRQLWWGHRIPVWYCDDPAAKSPRCKEPIVARSAPTKCAHCGSTRLRQDEDVLDTWFSSMLWPFSTLGWPEDTKDLRYFYPTDTLVTAPDIIFFWVARMIMAGFDVMSDMPGADGGRRKVPEDVVPFRDVYFTSIIRDATGRKMSKSLGNSPDPIDLIEQYGADALRFTVCYLAPLGQDVLFASEKCEIGRNFANKIWNAGRFLLMNRAEIGQDGGAKASGTLVISTGGTGTAGPADLADRWITSRLHTTISSVRKALDDFEINTTAKLIYDFVWHDFCDWYVEMIKSRLYAGGDSPSAEQRLEKAAVLHHAFGIFDGALRLLHPYMPFISEELWHAIGERRKGEYLMSSQFPQADSRMIDTTVEKEMTFLQEAINGVRNVRGELSVPPSREITVLMAGDGTAVLKKYEGYFRRLAKVNRIDDAPGGKKPAGSASVIVGKGELYIPLEGLIDLDAERGRLRKELERVTGLHAAAKQKLSNTSFVERAPAAVVDQEKKKLESFQDAISKLTRNLEAL